ncbi:metallophosphoesterase family protein [Zeaxanthinibacter sp. PT1]|uniref:metallophosphoesterase family protein n=1 Tax=Zeaxanthinibacter TaxID=561554 RepID=UPI00234B1405|nr:metallophosphoesterase family protein [Zeaxanthinibacter sp. PT1]MDC6350875.1 metallophosphoesterase family protein [Zeaxanthinibacter sp. PT1]
MRNLVIGDIHGGLRALEQVLERAQLSAEDRLIFLGDYVDGWSDAVETVNYLMELKTTHNCVLIRGNHDVLCADWLRTGNDNPLWEQHGGKATMASYRKWGEDIQAQHLTFYDQLDDYFLKDDEYLFLHAGFTNLKGVAHEYQSFNFYWDRTLWEMARALDPKLDREDPSYPPRLKNYKEIYIGHTPVTRMGETTPQQAGNVWNIDTGAAFKGPLTVLDIETKEYWQSDAVHTLYPEENGRN